MGVVELEEMLERNHAESAAVKKYIRKERKKELLDKQKEIRRILRDEMHSRLEESYGEAMKGYEDSPVHLPFLRYKNRAMVTSYANIARMVPPLGGSRLGELWEFPWLTTCLGDLRRAVEQGEALGMVGGPCLFGQDEVLIHVRLSDGSGEWFDLSCNKRCSTDSSEGELSLEDYMRQNLAMVEGMEIQNRKTGVTRQEYISLLYLFEAAWLLKARVVVPLPDLSYMKNLSGSLGGLDAKRREPIMERFRQECYKITDLFLECIEGLKKAYPGLLVTVLHERDRELCSLFCQKREPYIRNSSYMRKLTSREGRMDAVIDYITMLALPHYLYGVNHVIQLDSLDETDSGRKCQKIHGDAFCLHSLLYPEFLSRDKKHTIYNARFEDKEYMTLQDGI